MSTATRPGIIYTTGKSRPYPVDLNLSIRPKHCASYAFKTLRDVHLRAQSVNGCTRTILEHSIIGRKIFNVRQKLDPGRDLLSALTRLTFYQASLWELFHRRPILPVSTFGTFLVCTCVSFTEFFAIWPQIWSPCIMF